MIMKYISCTLVCVSRCSIKKLIMVVPDESQYYCGEEACPLDRITQYTLCTYSRTAATHKLFSLTRKE